MILNPLGISHVFRNTNATDQDTWEDASGRFPALSLPDVPTTAIALDDDDFNMAYVGTDVGVFRTTDGLFFFFLGRGVFARDVRFSSRIGGTDEEIPPFDDPKLQELSKTRSTG